MNERDVVPHPEPAKQESYIHGYEACVQNQQGRTAASSAAFLLPYLHAGMSMLDCGCGPGTITLGLAQVVDPGEVCGIDIEPKVITQARQNAETQGISNVRFETGDIYHLSFPDGTFDAVFSNTVLEHLNRPLDALVEVKRVLKRGGVIGIRSGLFDRWIRYPRLPLLEEGWRLYSRTWVRNGADPEVGIRQHALLKEAGFSKIVCSASCTLWADLERLTNGVISLLLQHTDEWIELGWADQPKIDAIIDAYREFGKNPDALAVSPACEAVAWKR